MRKVFNHLAEMKVYIAVSALLFVVSIVIGATSPLFAAFLESQLDSIRVVAESLQQLRFEAFFTGVFIFINNTITVVLAIYLGIALGIFPLIVLALNGMILGYLLALTSHEGIYNAGELFLIGILPHGIFELPAIIIACAYGLRLGVVMLRTLARRQKRQGEWGRLLRISRPVVLFVIILLFLASIIESTFTPWLLQIFS